MKILALVPARGGSKRLPRKNIRVLGDKPLIVWTLEAVRDIPSICDVLVSTDDPEIASVARNHHALVPWLRPAKLATDTATSLDVCLHALEWYELEKGRVDGLLLLQPTSPFRTPATISKGIELFRQYHRPVIGVSPAESHPMLCFKVEREKMYPFIESNLNVRSQDLPSAYVINGALYLISPQDLRQYQAFYTKKTLPLVINSPAECIDIDTEWDWQIAKILLTKV